MGENKKTDSKEVQKEEDALFLCRLCLWVCVGFVSCVSILPSTRPPPTRRLRPVSVGRSSTDTRDSAFRQFHTFYLQKTFTLFHFRFSSLSFVVTVIVIIVYY